ncbi:MAG: amidohydrolase family protein [Planctomycetes bacterium]|nr:amidohydrolase family protein [Planctomycetota bacterium]
MNPANRIGLDYRRGLARRAAGPVIDAHAHIRGLDDVALYFEVAELYGVGLTFSMSPLGEIRELKRRYPGRLEFIAVPNWSKQAATEEFQRSWMADLTAFREEGVRLCKFWMAPHMRKEHGLTLDHPFVKTVTRHAYELGFHFMTHIADPSIWWKAKYAGVDSIGSKDDQYRQLDGFFADYPDRVMIGAHMGGSVEELERLQGLLDRFPNYVIDTSATKWIVREVARTPDAVRAFIIRNQDRVMFGSDIVVDKKYDFDHYASRYWSQQMMWQSDYRGESPIEDPDGEDPPRLAGLGLPDEVLIKMYRTNAERLLESIRE